MKGSRYHQTNQTNQPATLHRNQIVPGRAYGSGPGRGETGEDGAEYLHGEELWRRRGSGAGGRSRYAAAVSRGGLEAVDDRRPVAAVRQETGPESFP